MTLYTENIERWKMLSDVDYFTQFVKTWVCFNAWYKTSFPELKTDRAAIEHIKSTNNKVKNEILKHLNNDYPENRKFKSFVGELHHRLESKYVHNKESRISFQEICIEENIKKKEEKSFNRISYRAERDVIVGTSKVVETEILNMSNARQFYFQQAKYNFSEIEVLPDFLALDTNRQRFLRIVYEDINPYKRICLIAEADSRDKIEIGGVYFVNDKERICKGIITTLYSIRNVLFHGEIVPDKETNRVYEPAFQMLKMIIEAL